MTHFRKHSKAIVALMCILTLLLQMSFVIPTMAAANELDVIFVLDDSASMKDTDPKKLSVTAISKFVDLVTTQDAEYGVAIYGDEVKAKLDLGATKDEVKSFVSRNAKQNQIHTNAAAGIKWATDELDAKGRSGAAKAIILIGDGVNDQDDGRTPAQTQAAEEKSKQDKEAAIQTAKAKGIPVYAIAVNESGDPNFKQYFEEIANETQGACYEPKNFGELESAVDKILTAVSGAQVDPKVVVNLDPNTPKTMTQRVDPGVYQLIIQCDYEEPLIVTVTSPSGVQYDERSPEYSNDTVNKYLQFTISNPEPGDWTITYNSPTGQTITYKGVIYGDVKVVLKYTTREAVIEGKKSRFAADVISDNKPVSEKEKLEGFDPRLAVVKVNADGTRKEPTFVDMSVENGQLSAEPKFKSVGEYVVYVELQGDTSTIKSNELTVDVQPDPNKLPLWAIILIILGVILLIVAAIFGLMAMRNAPDYINSELGVKITAKTPAQETMIFQNNVFNCSATFGKQNTFSDVIRAYVNWYRSIGSGELTEMTINQYLNSNLAEVTDRIKFSGTKSGKTVLVIPKGYDIEVDGNPVKADKKIEFASSEKEIEMIIKNNGYSYIIELMFRR